MTKKPLTIGTPEYVVWAKKGEYDGEILGKFDELVEELCDFVGNNDIDTVKLAKARRRLEHFFAITDTCECECDCY